MTLTRRSFFRWLTASVVAIPVLRGLTLIEDNPYAPLAATYPNWHKFVAMNKRHLGLIAPNSLTRVGGLT